MKQVIFWIVVLIGMFLIVNNGGAVNTILQTLSSTSLQGIATLQGRAVKGLTA